MHEWQHERADRAGALDPARGPQLGAADPPHYRRARHVQYELLEAGVEVNVIRGWLGHADLATTNRYAEINTKTKLAALQAAEVPAAAEQVRWAAEVNSLRSEEFVAPSLGTPVQEPTSGVAEGY